jgi:threonine dehydrogenase-like Zn-dependent dehydrogenase
VLDRVVGGPKPGLVEDLGATYHVGTVAESGLHPDIVIECTGVVSLVQQAAAAAAPGGIVCLTGVGSPSASTGGSGATLATQAVLKNLVMFGSVNANRRHYHRAARVLSLADRSWLERLITRRVRPDEVDLALGRDPDDIKVVMEFT